MTTEQRRWTAIVETRDDHYIVLVSHFGEPAGSITMSPDDTRERTDDIVSAITSLNERDHG